MNTQHTAHSTQQGLEAKLQQVKTILAQYGRVVVAFSGGIKLIAAPLDG